MSVEGKARRSQWAERYSAVTWAGRKGVLPHVAEMNCEDCGKQAQHKHHEDYSKPLEVSYLCAKCHKARHAKLGWGKGGAKLKYAFDHIPVFSWDYVEGIPLPRLSVSAHNYGKRFGCSFKCFSTGNGVVIFRTA